MRLIFFLFPVLALAGCATGPSLQSRMAAYTGASGETLVRDLGVPDKQISLNGTQYMAYVRQQTVVDPGPPVFVGGFGPYGGPFWGGYGGGFGGIYGADSPPSVSVWRCEATFTLQHDKVVGFALRGNDCG